MSVHEEEGCTVGPYADILDLPHRRSPYRCPMPRKDRAAQFASFAALTGFEAVVEEVARLTEERVELAEDEAERLDFALRRLAECETLPLACITYFLSDSEKAGGAYRTVRGRIREIDPCTGKLLLEDGTALPTENLRSIEWEG